MPVRQSFTDDPYLVIQPHSPPILGPLLHQSPYCDPWWCYCWSWSCPSHTPAAAAAAGLVLLLCLVLPLLAGAAPFWLSSHFASQRLLGRKASAAQLLARVWGWLLAGPS